MEGIKVINGCSLGEDIHLEDLRQRFDAVFIGVGLGAVNELGIENEQLSSVENAIDYIAALRQSEDFEPVAGRRASGCHWRWYDRD